MDSQVINEHTLQLIASLKIAWVGAFSYLFGEGGISNKWLRRFIGSSWMMLGVFAFSQWQGCWNNWYLLFLPLSIGALSNGYSASSVIGKILRRAVYGLLISLCAIPIVAHSHLWGLFACSVGLSVLSSALLGVTNPFKDARSEETVIATLCFLLTLFLI